MAKRPAEPHEHPYGDMVRDAWKATGLSVQEVLFRYKTEAVARNYSDVKDVGAVKFWLYGWSIPQIHQYDALAKVLNEELKAQGKKGATLPRFPQSVAHVVDAKRKLRLLPGEGRQKPKTLKTTRLARQPSFQQQAA